MPNATLPYKLVLLQQIYEQGLTSLYTNIKGKKTNVKGVSKINKKQRNKQERVKRKWWISYYHLHTHYSQHIQY